MSEHGANDPFASPGPGVPQWEGTPVPLPPTYVPPPLAHIPPPSYGPPSTYVPPPMPQNAASGMIAYPPPPPVGYTYGPAYNPASTANNWMGIAALILSLATLIFGITCIPGVVLGHMGLSAAKKGTANNKGIALAGVIIGWVFVGLGLLFVAFIAIAVAIGDSGT